MLMAPGSAMAIAETPTLHFHVETVPLDSEMRAWTTKPDCGYILHAVDLSHLPS